jgi:hypothetical protein
MDDVGHIQDGNGAYFMGLKHEEGHVVLFVDFARSSSEHVGLLSGNGNEAFVPSIDGLSNDVRSTTIWHS